MLCSPLCPGLCLLMQPGCSDGWRVLGCLLPHPLLVLLSPLLVHHKSVCKHAGAGGKAQVREQAQWYIINVSAGGQSCGAGGQNSAEQQCMGHRSRRQNRDCRPAGCQAGGQAECRMQRPPDCAGDMGLGVSSSSCSSEISSSSTEAQGDLHHHHHQRWRRQQRSQASTGNLASVVVVQFLGGRRSPPSTRSPPTHPPTHLDAQQDLFDCDGGAPTLVLVQDAEADSA